MPKFKILLITTCFLITSYFSNFSSAEAIPKLTFETETLDFGRVESGNIVEGTFKFRNEGDQTLTIYTVKAICDCTKAEISSKTIEPKAQATLKVTLDTSSKLGKIEKEIFIISNDPKRPNITLRVLADVYFTHPKKTQKNIFSEGCNSCHSKRGEGKLGYDLYLADCAMCHGNTGEGTKSGPALNNLQSKSKDYIKTKTAQGTGNPMMPGFSQKYGGPLSNSQIESLVEVIYNLLR